MSRIKRLDKEARVIYPINAADLHKCGVQGNFPGIILTAYEIERAAGRTESLTTEDVLSHPNLSTVISTSLVSLEEMHEELRIVRHELQGKADELQMLQEKWIIEYDSNTEQVEAFAQEIVDLTKELNETKVKLSEAQRHTDIKETAVKAKDQSINEVQERFDGSQKAVAAYIQAFGPLPTDGLRKMTRLQRFALWLYRKFTDRYYKRKKGVKR